MSRAIVSVMVIAALLACDERASSVERAPSAASPRGSLSERAPALDEVDPCTELGVIVPRLSVELHAPRAGLLRATGAELHGVGELVYAIEAGDDVAVLEAQEAELAEAAATRERYAAERGARARALRNAEQLGEYLADDERDSARDAHAIASRELDRADAVRRAASARLEAQRARIEAGRLEAPFAGRVVRELAVPGSRVEAGQALGRFASTDDLVLRVGLPAELALPGPVELRWHWPEQPEQSFAAVLRPASEQVDELSGLRLYEAVVDADSLADHALGDSVRVELPRCHGGPTRTRTAHGHP